jgi:hypothetical protein
VSGEWSDKVTTELQLQNPYKSWYGRLRGEETSQLLAANPANSVIVQLITLPKEVVAKQDSTTAFSILLTLQNTKSGPGARGDYT